MKKRAIAFFLTMVLAVSCVSPLGITAYAGDTALVTWDESEEVTVEGQSANLTTVTESGLVTDETVTESSATDESTLSEELQTDEDVQTSGNEGISDEPEEVLLLDEPAGEDLMPNESTQDVPAKDEDTQDTPALGMDTSLTVDDIEVMDEAGIQLDAEEISSVIFPAKTSYNIFDSIQMKFFSSPITIVYEDGSREMIDEWEDDFYYFDTDEKMVCYGYARNGRRLILTLYRDGQMVNIDDLFVGECELKVYKGSISETNEIKNLQNNKIALSFPSENVTEVTSTIADTLEADRVKYYHIPAQGEDKTLYITFDEMIESGYGEIKVYERSADDLSEPLYEELDFWRGQFDTYFRLNRGKEYWIVLEEAEGEESTYDVKMSLEGKQTIISISIEGIEKNTYDVSETGDLFCYDLEVDVNYISDMGRITEEKVTKWKWYTESDGTGHYYSRMFGKTRYHDEVIVELKNLNNSYASIPKASELVVLPGNYKVIAYVENQEIKAEEIPIKVTCTDGIAPLDLDKEYLIDSSAGDRLGYKLFSYTPTRSGYYIFDFPTGDTTGVASVSIYDSSSLCLEYYWDDDIPALDTLYEFLESGKTYYFGVSFYSETHTAVRLSKEYTVTSMTLEAPPTETTYAVEYNEDDDCYYVDAKIAGMKVRVNYADGRSLVIDVDDEDEYEEYFDLGYCPFNADGSPDLSRIKSIESPVDPSETGTYALLAGEGEWDGSRLYFPDTPVWVKIVIVSKYHVHSWNAPTVDIAPTCVTEGKQSIYCSSCGEMKPGSTTLIPKLEHKWSDWSITTQGKAILTRICATCHTRESKSFKPVLTLTDGNLSMKTGQSTTKFKVTTMSEYDSLVSVKSSNTKLLRVSNVAANGTFKLKAQKKTGTAKLTVTLKSGKTKTIKVKVQKAEVRTTKIKVKKKKLTLKKKQKIKLAPVITPVTSYDKVKYTSSNKKVAVVNNKGQITAKSKGTATITVKSGKKNVKVKVTVK